MITERLHAVGEWNLTLDGSTPPSLLQRLTLTPGDPRTIGAGTLVITEAWIDPHTLTDGDTGTAHHPLLDLAIFSGIITAAPSRYALAGHGLAWHLGTPDGFGELIVGNAMTSATEQNARLLREDADDWLNMVINGATLTSWDDDATSITFRSSRLYDCTYHGTPTGQAVDVPYFPEPVTRGELLTRIADYAGLRWYVSPRGWAHMGTPAALFPDGPRAVIAADLDRDPGWMTISVPDGINWDQDLAGHANKWVSFNTGKNDTYPQNTIYAFPNDSNPTNVFYRGLDGVAHHLVERDDANNEENILSWADRIINGRAAREQIRRQITITGTPDSIGHRLTPGEPVHLFDPEADLVDLGTQIHVGGQTLHPAQVDLHGVTWPVLSGMGVYVLFWDDDTDEIDFYDLTRMVIPEDGADTTLDVGAPRFSL